MHKFRYYMQQDYMFLIEFCRAIALSVAKTNAIENMAWFAHLLDETLNTEMALHQEVCRNFGITKDQLRATIPSPTTHAYT